MNLKSNYRLRRLSKGYLLFFLSLVLVLTMGVATFAASKHTTKPAITVQNGRWNPARHDRVKCYVNFCNKHKKKPHASKVSISYQVKSSAKNTKIISASYNSSGRGVYENAPAYTEYNKGKKFITYIETQESDKYVAYGRYKTGDCYCLTCQIIGSSDAEKYCNLKWSKWKSE